MASEGRPLHGTKVPGAYSPFREPWAAIQIGSTGPSRSYASRSRRYQVPGRPPSLAEPTATNPALARTFCDATLS
jgi:hypothetical protein